jgi:8-oxo-dGTP pyrophosphatase MutT (NUDIX family)
MIPTKSCPVVIRGSAQTEILLFRHPLAGIQLVKGTIQNNEGPQTAALRELYEESGILDADVIADLGVWDSAFNGDVWSFHLVRTNSMLPDQWEHRTKDDGGHTFIFFWHPLRSDLGDEAHPVYRKALDYVRSCELLKALMH